MPYSVKIGQERAKARESVKKGVQSASKAPNSPRIETPYSVELHTLIDILQEYNDNNLATSDIKRIINHANPNDLLELVETLNQNEISLRKKDPLGRNNFDALIEHPNPSDLLKLLKQLSATGLLSDNINTLLIAKPSYFASIMLLSRNQLSKPTQTAVNACIPALAQIFEKQPQLLTQNNFNTLTQSTNLMHIPDLAQILKKIPQSLHLTENNFNALIIRNKILKPFIDVLNLLHDTSLILLLTQERFKILIDKPLFINKLVSILNILKKNQLISYVTQENFDTLINYIDFNNLHEILTTLNWTVTLKQEHFDILINYKDPENLNETLFELSEAGLLTQENVDILLVNHTNFKNICPILSMLNTSGLLIQKNYERLLSPENSLLISDMQFQNIWGRLMAGDNNLTQDIFNQLIKYLQEDRGQQALQNYVNHLSGNHINYAQSIHVPSVEQSTFKSVKRLADRYKTEIEGEALEKTIKRVTKYISGLDESLKNKAVKRYIERITTKNNYNLPVPNLGCSVKQLLALIFLAMHDPKHCTAKPKDAQIAFIEGLYEIQRGNNLDDNGLEKTPTKLNKIDESIICIEGTISKLVEILWGIHDDVNIKFITLAAAAEAYPMIVIDEAKKYLAANPETDPEDTESLFKEIKTKVTESILTEFESVFSPEQPSYFINFIDAGKYALEQALEENKFKKEIEEFQKSKERHAPPTNSIGRPGFFAAENQAQSTEQEHNTHDTENYNKPVKWL